MPANRIVRLRSPELLRTLRDAEGLSQYALAAHAGVTRGAVAHWENGRRDRLARHEAAAIAHALHVPARVLFDAVKEGAADGTPAAPGSARPRGMGARAGRTAAAAATR